MTQEQKNKYFDYFCIAEFISCFLLFCIAMPLKYEYDILAPMFPIGMFHGIAFTGYLILAFKVKDYYKWDDEEMVFVVLFAFIPFATWLIHRKIKKFDERNEN